MFDGPMKFRFIIIASFTQNHKVFARFRNHITMKFEIEWSKIGDQPHITWPVENMCLISLIKVVNILPFFLIRW